jgi:glycosyltransferase involved in cell wall biosynthesis
LLYGHSGYGLNILQAMAAGKPVIVTNYGGNADFLTRSEVRKAHYAISYTLGRVEDPNGPYKTYANCRWAYPIHR